MCPHSVDVIGYWEICPVRSCEQTYVRCCVFERRHCLASMGRIIIALSLEVILLSLSIQTGELLQINGYFNDDIVVMEINYKINFAITVFLYT